MGFSTTSAEICGEDITGMGVADTSETGRDPVLPVGGIGGGGGGGQLETLARHGTDVSKWEWDDAAKGPASDDHGEG